ncbi:MAG: PhoPQ-activated pathogenicity-related family protein [Phycisphaerae bacterium]|nr:PhoPQ-activated pathogenicity-related family protein [Phycisphaerae bacterium]
MFKISAAYNSILNFHSARVKVLLASAWILLLFSLCAHATELDDYIAAPDANYKYEIVDTQKGEGYTAYIIKMTSQTWRKASEIDSIIWWHWLTIIKPDKVDYDKSLLWIDGGSNKDTAPTKPDNMLLKIALKTNSIVSDLKMVPNQPLTLQGQRKNCYEDAIIARSIDMCFKTDDYTWPLFLPMTKSAVRAMDTIQKVIEEKTKGKLKVNNFIVSGASKRGWTTWLTAAVDKRVVAIVPVVIDILNVNDHMQHHHDAYGFYAEAIGDYDEMNIMARLDTAKGQKIRKIIDPYEYIDRLTIPKLLINASGDQFFLPDSSQFYFNRLQGEKHLRYIPNVGHSLQDSDAAKSLASFYLSILDKSQRPKVTWSYDSENNLRIEANQKPQLVKSWQATNKTARDFRINIIGKAWESKILKPDKDGKYLVKIQEPAKGWTGFFVEMTFAGKDDIPFIFTTNIKVLPETLPFKSQNK